MVVLAELIDGPERVKLIDFFKKLDQMTGSKSSAKFVGPDLDSMPIEERNLVLLDGIAYRVVDEKFVDPTYAIMGKTNAIGIEWDSPSTSYH